VSDDALWLKGGRYWLRALTAQWMGMEREHANTLVPVLVSSEQGLGKSTFCRSLLPDSLRAYYLDNLNLSPSASPEKKLVKAGLINLDEFDKISEKRQPDLKNLLQMMSVPIYRGKRLGYVTEPRLASFIATACASLQQASGGYVVPFVLLLSLSVVSILLNLTVKKP
jgi:hypothetical protein